MSEELRFWIAMALSFAWGMALPRQKKLSLIILSALSGGFVALFAWRATYVFWP